VEISGKTCNEFGAVNRTKCVWRPGSVGTRWWSYNTPPDPLAVEGKGWEIRGGKGWE